MFFLDFYKNRKYLDNEYKEPDFDEKTGLPYDEIKEGLHRIADEKIGKVSSYKLYAELFEYLYDNARIQINPYNIFSAKAEFGLCMRREIFGKIKSKVLGELSPETFELQALGRECGASPVGDYHHTLPDWNDIIGLGFFGILERAKKRREELSADACATEEQIDFIDAVIKLYSAMMRNVRRMRDEAAKYDGTEHFCECIDGILAHAPRTTYEAMMTSVLFSQFYECGYENSRSIGRIDLMYAPLYRADIDSGRYTEAELREMIRYFLNTYFAMDRWAGQPLCLGGSFADGSYIDTEMTELFLDVYDELDIGNPKIHVRCSDSMPRALLLKILGMIRRGHSSIVLINDETIYRGYERIGISREESQYFLPQGCYESNIMGLEEPLICSSWVSIPKAVELALSGGVDMLTGKVTGAVFEGEPKTFDEFYSRFIAQIDAILEIVFKAVESELEHQNAICPSIAYSGTVASCIERARGVRDGGMKYNNTSVKCCGIATAVDSLMIIKKYVYEEKKITLTKLAELMKNNWQGGEALRRSIMKEKERYGNGLPVPDGLAKQIYEHIAGVVIGRKNNIGGVYRLGADSVMHCVDHAQNVAATPDGRGAREPYSRNMCSVTGMDLNGVTANVLSVTAMDHSYFIDGGICDFVVHPSAVEGDEGLAALETLVKVYFARGGMAIQGNVFGLEDLLAAQKEPEKYANLQVRVCGWNEYFVRMNAHKQNEFIERCRNLM